MSVSENECGIPAKEPSLFVMSFHLLFFHFFSSRDSTQVYYVDLGESFHMSICLQNLASIQPRTSPVKFRTCTRNTVRSIPVYRHGRRRHRLCVQLRRALLELHGGAGRQARPARCPSPRERPRRKGNGCTGLGKVNTFSFVFCLCTTRMIRYTAIGKR